MPLQFLPGEVAALLTQLHELLRNLLAALYAHEGDDLYEKPAHPHNVFWHQAQAANQLYDMFDGKQREQSLVI